MFFPRAVFLWIGCRVESLNLIFVVLGSDLQLFVVSRAPGAPVSLTILLGIGSRVVRGRFRFCGLHFFLEVRDTWWVHSPPSLYSLPSTSCSVVGCAVYSMDSGIGGGVGVLFWCTWQTFLM